MKQFIVKTILYLLPFVLLISITYFFLSRSESPDLLRMGYIPSMDYNYRDNFVSPKHVRYENLSNVSSKIFDVLTIGDSFSDQGIDGYQNYLANHYSVVNVDRSLAKNPIHTLIGLANCDFFDRYKIRYVVLENVERYLFDNIRGLTADESLCLLQIDSLLMMERIKKSVERQNEFKLFTKQIIVFPFYYFPLFMLYDDYLSNELVYNFKLKSSQLFSNNSDNLLFYFYDLEACKKYNSLDDAHRLNGLLNKLNKLLLEKGVQLIFVPAPDKYDLYFDYISNCGDLIKPLFFENFRSLPKDYLYVDSKDVLIRYLEKTRDIYYFDDSHWSGLAAEIMANELRDVIQLNSQ